MENHQVEFYQNYEYEKGYFYTGYAYKDKDGKLKGHGNGSIKYDDGSTYLGQVIHGIREG